MSKNTKTSPAGGEPSHLRQFNDPTVLTKRHLRFGWWALLLFLATGLVLEGLHGLKAPFYLKVGNESRWLMWRLGHAHGTLLALVNIAFAFSARLLPEWRPRERGMASVCLRLATGILPGGFLLGGLFIQGGDPGPGILLVPVGGLLLLSAVFLVACGAGTFRIEMHGADTSSKKR